MKPDFNISKLISDLRAKGNIQRQSGLRRQRDRTNTRGNCGTET